MNRDQWADMAEIPEVPSPVAPRTATDAGAGEEKPKLPPPQAFALGSLLTPPENDPHELLKFRYLCRGGALLFVGQSGVGKSTLAMQAAMCWAVGRDFFRITPARPLRSLIIQSENDNGDLAEMRDGVLHGLGFTEEERNVVLRDILVATEDVRVGQDFCDQVLAPMLAQHQPDLLWIDPALAYLGGEANSQKDVGAFLRNGLNPLAHQHRCGIVVLHHCNKPPSGSEKPKWNGTDFAYLGSGSAEWANWPRAVLALRSVGSHTIFELKAGKRGARLRWEDDDGNRSYGRLIGHALGGGMHWREVPEEELEQEQGGGEEARIDRRKPSMEEFLGLFPTTFKDKPREALLSADQLKNLFHDHGWHRNFYAGLADEAESKGLIQMIIGEGRGGQKLRGLPEMVAAYQTRLAERDSLMEQVPLRVKAKRPKTSASKNGKKRR